MDDDVEVFGRLGYRSLERPSPFEAVLEPSRGGPRIVLRLAREGKVFGGNWALEVLPAEPVLPATDRGLAARGRGVARMRGVSFRARRGSGEDAARLADALSADEALGEALSKVDFERLYVEPDGRPAIRHLGGSVVWVIFPPIVRATPMPPEQARRTAEAIEAFAAAGQRLAPARAHQASKSRSA
jgi:hypothetical protein